MEKNWKQCHISFSWAPQSLQMVTVAMKLKGTCSLEEKLWPTNLDSILKSRDITLPTKVHLVKAMVFAVVIYGCESWTINKVECWSTDAFKLWCWRRLESPLDFKEIKPVKGNQLWIFIERTDAEVLNTSATSCKEPTHWKRSWCWERLKGTTEDEMVGWHHRLDGHEFEQALVDGEGREAWCAAVHEVMESQTLLGNWTKQDHIQRF